MKREIFKNAPLIEMIAEVRWALTPVATVPNGGVDPFHEHIKNSLRASLRDGGFGLEFEIVPPEVPRELLAGQVTSQFRRSANEWPLYQLGPGVFTVNMTGGYRGWDSFKKVLCPGVDLLLKAHPAPAMLSINALKLIAIDAFTAEHGYERYASFASDFLGLSQVLPSSFLTSFASDAADVNVRSESAFALRELPHSVARINVSEGRKEKDRALLLHTSVETTVNIRVEAEWINQWFDDAHRQHREMFRSLLSDRLRERLKPIEV